MTSRTHFAHIRNSPDARSGGYTIAFRFADNTKGIVWEYARCNSKDNFNKKIGRDIAEGRMEANPRFLTTKAQRYATVVGKLVDITSAEILQARRSAAKRK